MRLFLLLLLLTISMLYSKRIVTLSPALSEIVYGLGEYKTLVGVSSFATYPKKIRTLTKIGGLFSPSLETILLLKPTLVIGQEYNMLFLDKLKQVGIKTLSVPLNTLEEIKQGIKSVAKALEVSWKFRVNAIKKSLKKANSYKRGDKKILIIYGLIKDPKHDAMFIASKYTFFDDIIKACGAKNAFLGRFKKEPRLHLENLIALNPDQIIMLSSLNDDHINRDAILKNWSNLPIKAFKHKNIYILNKDYLLIPSYRVAKSITTLCEVIKK